MSADGLTFPIPEELVERVSAEVAGRLAERMVPPAEPYMNVEEAATYLACDKKRIYDIKASGTLAFYRDGKRILFKRCDLDAYVSSGVSSG
jgi:excisionase family DNA binding protein